MWEQTKEEDNQKMGVLGFPIHNTTCLKIKYLHNLVGFL